MPVDSVSFWVSFFFFFFDPLQLLSRAHGKKKDTLSLACPKDLMERRV